jgi:hypothetical protein
MLKFRVEFKGKKFPEELRRTLGFVAPSEDRAKEWVAKQISEWRLPENTQFELSPEKEPEKKK